MILWYTDFTGQESQGFVVEMFLIPLQYHVMFILPEQIAISVASTWTGNLFKICSSVEILLVERNWNTMKPTRDFSATLFIGFLCYAYSHNKNPSVLHCAVYLRRTAVNHITVNPLNAELNPICHPQHNQTGSNSSTIAAHSSNGVTNTRCCRYSCMRSWWCVEVPPETCRAVSRCKWTA
jgi:hypothetical protein